MRLIPHAAAISEFVSGYNGDCGETAEMALLHVINPASYPLNSADLSTIVKRDISKGWASSNGSEPISAIANDLAAEGIAHTNYGYSEPPSFDWKGELVQWGGIKPIVFEYSHAGALPGDESGVAYHFNCCLGWDPAAQVGLFADGDNLVERQGGTALVRYTESDLVAAGVCGMLVGEYQLGGTMTTVPAGWSDDGTTLKAPGNATPVTGAIRDYIIAHPAWDPQDVPEGPQLTTAQVEFSDPAHGGGLVQYFRFSAIAETQALGAYRLYAGAEIQAARALINTLDTQAQKDAATIGTQSGQIATLTAQVAQLKAQLANAQNAPAPAAAPTTPADAAALLVSLIYAQADATLKAASQAPTAG